MSIRTYHHRQPATVIRWAVGLAAAVVAAITVLVAMRDPAIAVIPAVVLVVLGVSLGLFGALTVEVTPQRLSLRFGPGVVRKEFPMNEISAAGAVRNRWYYGWGIRLTPHGWLFNVSGLDAVEIELTDGRKYRIGTDEPQRLVAAIREASGLAGSR